MGFTEKLPNGKHRARWIDQTGRQRSKTFERERDAKRHARNVESDIDRGIYMPCSQYEALFVSAAHTEDDIRRTVSAASEVLREVSL